VCGFVWEEYCMFSVCVCVCVCMGWHLTDCRASNDFQMLTVSNSSLRTSEIGILKERERLPLYG